MLVLVSPFLSFLSLCLQVKADVGIIRRGHRDMRNAYHDRVSLVRNQSIARLRDRFGAARSANLMFRVFSKFNGLFVRRKVRAFFTYCDLSAERH